jgi:hypothetical protein
MDRRGQVVLRYAPGENFNGSLHDIAGVCNERRQRVRADAPPRARRRRADRGLDRRAEDLRVDAPGRSGARGRMPETWSATLPTVEDALALGLTRAEYELVCEKQGGAPNQVELAMYSLLWSEHCAYKHSKKLLRTLPTEGSARGDGPRRERRRGRCRRRAGVRVQGRVAQPPERGRAVPGRGDGRRRDPARHLRDRARSRADRCVLDSLRFGEPSSGTAHARYLLDGAVRGSATTATRSACRPSAGRCTSRGPTSRTAWSTRWRSASPARAADAQRGRRAPATCSCCSAPRTGRDGIGGASVLASAELGEAATARTSARPCRSAIRSRRRSCWSARSSCSSAGCSSRCRTSARRA